nr:isoaspartyl peptidase/L-asparaginase [Deltaproteobacteria bacterium]
QADTVGAVAIDRHGALCAGGSTGGVLLQDPGRVGDCPLVGAGLFASAALGAACATGVGEAILTHVASYAALTEAARAPTPEHAVAEVCARVAATPIAQGTATCGIILIDPHGQVAVAHHSPHMSWAIARGTDAVEAGLQR